MRASRQHGLGQWRRTVCQHFDKPDAQGFRCVDQAAGIQQALGLAGADEIGQQFYVVQRVDETKLGRGNPETCPIGRNPQVACQCQSASAADAIALDEGNGGKRQARKVVLDRIDRPLVRLTPGGVVLVREQLANIGTRAENAAVGRTQDQESRTIVLDGLREQIGHGLPHRQVQGIALVRPIDQQMRGRPVEFEAQAQAGFSAMKWSAIALRVVTQTPSCWRTCLKNSSSAQMRPGRPMMRRCRPRLIILGWPSAPSR